MNKKTVKISNRSAGVVSYRIPEDNIYRKLQPGEPRVVTLDELEKLSYQPGGGALLADYILIHDPEVVESTGVHVEPEYFMTADEVIELIKNGSLDAWLDCLDFAPDGVKDMIKQYSVSVPLSDYEKRKALKEKLGFDADAAIRYEEERRAESGNSTETKKRRTQTAETAEKTEETAPARRTTATYNIKKKG